MSTGEVITQILLGSLGGVLAWAFLKWFIRFSLELLDAAADYLIYRSNRNKRPGIK